MTGVVVILGVALASYGLYELNWWITRRQFPDLFGDDA